MMIEAIEVTTRGDSAGDERVFECHDVERGYKAKIRLHHPTGRLKKDQDKLRAIAIAEGHFTAKARAEGKALV